MLGHVAGTGLIGHGVDEFSYPEGGGSRDLEVLQTKGAATHPLDRGAFHIDGLGFIRQKDAKGQFHPDRDRFISFDPPAFHREVADLTGSDYPLAEVIEEAADGNSRMGAGLE